ncbi:VOC family protein [Dyella sp. 2HG41-7]|uniref:VOC family protein n=1 Tax=Dyella sp. 2HG41-7 TaxID=2883239 RepID=UPI001F45B37A|nr:VOC family protein [Dyella sp. 2HG41-7]
MTASIRSSRDIIIRTDDWPAAIAFYTSTLGFEVVYRSDTMMGFETGSFRLYVEKGEAHGPVFDFLVQNVQATKQALLASGCTLIEEDPAVPRCYLRDPFGMTFNLGLRDSSP